MPVLSTRTLWLDHNWDHYFQVSFVQPLQCLPLSSHSLRAAEKLLLEPCTMMPPGWVKRYEGDEKTVPFRADPEVRESCLTQASSRPNMPSQQASGWLDWMSKNVPPTSVIFLDTAGATKARIPNLKCSQILNFLTSCRFTVEFRIRNPGKYFKI